jgi:hypothetical protein
LLYSEHPTTSIRFNESPLSEYRCAKIDQQYGGILARLQPVYAREKEFSGVMLVRGKAAGIDEASPGGYGR